MVVKPMSRAADEILLHWMELRELGHSSAKIGKSYGTTGERIRVATNRVRNDYAKSLKLLKVAA